MPWLSWKIGDSSKKAVWKIGIVETAALRWALRRTSTFLEFNMVPGYVRRRKGRGKGEEEGNSIVSPLLPSLTSPFFSPFSQADVPVFCILPMTHCAFPIFRATVMQNRDSRCFFHCTFWTWYMSHNLFIFSWRVPSVYSPCCQTCQLLHLLQHYYGKTKTANPAVYLQIVTSKIL